MVPILRVPQSEGGALLCSQGAPGLRGKVEPLLWKSSRPREGAQLLPAGHSLSGGTRAQLAVNSARGRMEDVRLVLWRSLWHVRNHCFLLLVGVDGSGRRAEADSRKDFPSSRTAGLVQAGICTRGRISRLVASLSHEAQEPSSVEAGRGPGHLPSVCTMRKCCP